MPPPFQLPTPSSGDATDNGSSNANGNGNGIHSDYADILSGITVCPIPHLHVNTGIRILRYFHRGDPVGFTIGQKMYAVFESAASERPCGVIEDGGNLFKVKINVSDHQYIIPLLRGSTHVVILTVENVNHSAIGTQGLCVSYGVASISTKCVFDLFTIYESD